MKYKLLVYLTLLLPISSFLIISAITGKTYDAELFKATESSVVEFREYDDGYVVYSENASYNGYLVAYNDTYALYIEDSDIVKIDNDFFTVYEGNFSNIDDIPPIPQQTSKWVVSISSIVALGLAALIIGGKMDLLKKHPRISALVSLGVITAILYGLNSIISDMLSVFIVATASWAVYCIEYLIHQGTINAKEGEKAETDLLNALKGLVK